MPPNYYKVDYFVWTDSEDELLLNVTLEYKAGKSSENVDWESCKTKYPDILALFLERFPTETNTDFPHRKDEVNRNVLTAKLKAIRSKFKAAIDSGRKNGHGKVVMLYYELCEQIWGGSPATTTLPSGFETADLEPAFTMESADPSELPSCGAQGDVARWPPTRKGNFFVWTDREVELLLNVTIEYKAGKSIENVDWESCKSKYADILALFLEQCPTETNTDFPHRKEEVNRNVLTAKLKNIRWKYKAAVDSGRKKDHGRVVKLYYELCKQIWGGSPATTSTTTLPSACEMADIDPACMESADPSDPSSCGAQGDVAKQPPTKKGGHFKWTDSEVELLLNVTLEYKVGKSFENERWESRRFKYHDILALFLERCPTETNTDFPHHKEEVNMNVLSSKVKAIKALYMVAVDTGRKNRVVMLYFDLCEQIWGGSPATTTLPSGFETADVDPACMESTDPSDLSSYGTQGSPILPLSSLRLIVPPLQLVSAALLEIVKKGAVMYYGILEEFVSTLLETVPGMLTYREGVQLVMGLRARVVLELCRTDEASPHTIQPHLTRIKTHITKMNKEGSDLEVKTSLTNFIQLVNSLVDDPGQRDAFYKNIFPTVFGPKYDSALQALMMKLLSNLQKLLPVPNIEQTGDWLSLSPSILKECVELVNKPQPLNTLIQHRKVLKSTTKGWSSSGEEDCILSSLSYHFQKEDAGTRNTSTNSGSTSAPEGWQNHVSIGNDFKTAEKSHETTWNVVGGEERHVDDLSEDRGHSIEVEHQHDSNDSSDIEIDTEKNIICGKTITYPKSFDKHLKSCVVVMNKINRQTDLKSSAALTHDPEYQPLDKDKGGCSPTKNMTLLPELSLSYEPSEEPMYKRSSRAKKCSLCGEIFTSGQDLTKHMRYHNEQSPVLCFCGKDFDHDKDCEKYRENECRASNPHPQTKKDFAQEKSLASSSKRNQRRASSLSSSSQTLSDPDAGADCKHAKTTQVWARSCRVILSCNFHSVDKPHENHQGENGMPEMKDGKVALLTSSADLTEDHQRQPGVIMCTMCEKNFLKIADMKKHYSESHQVSGPYPCPLCKRSFVRLVELVRHHKKQKLYQCSSCTKCFISLFLLNVHEKSHERLRPICETCKKSFKSLSHLTQHQKTHRNEQPWICSYCSKQFSRKDSLKAHMVRHTGGYPCPTCGKKFNRMIYLKWHQYKHTGQNPEYLCDTCGKGCPSRAQLKIHMFKHTEERPFKCEQCGLCCKTQTHLRSHRRDKHIGLRPFVCEVCSKAFSINSQLKKHSMVHTGERPFKCPRCGKTFARKHRLRKHRADKKCLEIA